MVREGSAGDVTRPFARGGRRLTLRVTPSLWKQVLAAAYEKQESVSEYTRQALRVALKEREDD